MHALPSSETLNYLNDEEYDLTLRVTHLMESGIRHLKIWRNSSRLYRIMVDCNAVVMAIER